MRSNRVGRVLLPMPESQQSRVQFQHPPTQNLGAADDAVLSQVQWKQNPKIALLTFAQNDCRRIWCTVCKDCALFFITYQGFHDDKMGKVNLWLCLLTTIDAVDSFFFCLPSSIYLILILRTSWVLGSPRRFCFATQNLAFMYFFRFFMYYVKGI